MTPCTGTGAGKLCPRRHQCQRFIAFMSLPATPGPVAVHDKPLSSECWRIVPVIESDKPKRCQYNDSGFCYAPGEAKTNAKGGQCQRPMECPENNNQEMG